MILLGMVEQYTLKDFQKDPIFSTPFKGIIMKIAVCLSHNTIYHISNGFYGSLHITEIRANFGPKHQEGLIVLICECSCLITLFGVLILYDNTLARGYAMAPHRHLHVLVMLCSDLPTIMEFL